MLPPAVYGPLATVNATTGQNRFHDAWSQEVRIASPDNQRVRWIIGGYFVATDLDVMISVNRDTGGGDVVQETDPNIGGVNPTAPWNERFVAAVAPVFTANPGAIPPSCLTGPLPPAVCAANLANPNQNAAALSYNYDRNDNNAYALFGQANASLGKQVEASFALRYDRDARELTSRRQTAICPCFRSRALARATCARRRSTRGSRKRRSAGSRPRRSRSTACFHRASGAADST